MTAALTPVNRTGAASGFGAAIAVRYAAEGCKVLLGDLNQEGAANVARRCEGTDASTAVKMMNVSSETDWREAVQTCVEKWGRLDIVVNNAGTSYKNKVSGPFSGGEGALGPRPDAAPDRP